MQGEEKRMGEALSPAGFGAAEAEAARILLELALREDLGERGDITSNLLIDEREQACVAIVARSAGVVCGLPVAALVLERLDARCRMVTASLDGSAVVPGETVALLTGSTRSLLTAERTLLNFMTHLSGIASLTQHYVARVAGTAARILDTRKTHPGYRLLEKYAVRCGGGHNHRLGLFDGFMIKDNHLAARRRDFPAESPTHMIQLAREAWPELPLTVEVDTLDQLRELLPGNPDIALLDNMSREQLREAVHMRDGLAPGTLLEASGGVNLDTVHAIASTGVDRISVGALTHSAPALDLGFDWRE